MSSFEFCTSFFKELITVERVRKLDVHFVCYPYCKSFPVKLNNIVYAWHIKKYFSRFNSKFDLIHAQSIFDAGLHANFINDLFSIPFIFTEHNQVNFLKKSKKSIASFKRLIKKPYPKLVVSNDKIRQFAANEIFEDFINVGNYVDEKNFFYSNFESQEHFTITTIGAYNAYKDQVTLLRSLEIVDKNTTKNITFNWIGFDGWGTNYQEKIETLLSKFNFKNIKVNTYPHLNRNEIAAQLQKSDVFVLSSISEGMPVSVLEALACGVPVCSTNCGGVDEVIDQTNGQIVPIKDFNKIAEFILEMLAEKRSFDRELIAQNIIKKFGSSAFRDKLHNIYQETITTFSS